VRHGNRDDLLSLVLGIPFTDPSYVELTVGVARADYPNVWLALQPVASGTGNQGPALLYTTDG